MATLSEQQVKLPSSLRNILGLFLSSGMAQGAALVALPLLQRYCYGPSAFADMAVYSQLVGILGAVATFRFDLALVKRESADAARATVAIGLRVLTVVTLAAGLLALGLKYADSATGAIAGLWLLLPCGVFGMGVNGLVTGWLSRQERFGTLAWVRGGGSTLGEVARFLTAPMGASGPDYWPHHGAMVHRSGRCQVHGEGMASSSQKHQAFARSRLESRPGLCAVHDSRQCARHGRQWCFHLLSLRILPAGFRGCGRRWNGLSHCGCRPCDQKRERRFL